MAVPREAIRNRVFELMGVSDSRPLRITTNPEIHRILKPKEGAFDEPGARNAAVRSFDYPLTQAGDLSRLPIEFQNEWFSRKEIDEILFHDPKILRLERKTGAPGFLNLIRDAREHALLLRSGKAYSEEWKTLPPEHIQKGVVAKAGEVPTKANEFNAERVAAELVGQADRGVRPVLFDVGTGGGGTLLPIIQRIAKQNPETLKRLKIAFLDVMPAGVEHVKKELAKLGVGEEQMVPMVLNFMDLAGVEGFEATLEQGEKAARNDALKELEKLRGKVTVITSGAAVHHVSDVTPMFAAFNRLLSRDGKVIMWDWGHHRTQAPQLRLSEMHRAVEGVTEGIAPKQRDTVVAMANTWMSLLGYSRHAQEKVLKKMQEYERKGKPFDFQKLLATSRVQLESFKTARLNRAYNEQSPVALFHEGHRPPILYKDAMQRAGLVVEHVKYPLVTRQTKPTDTENLLYFIEARKK